MTAGGINSVPTVAASMLPGISPFAKALPSVPQSRTRSSASSRLRDNRQSTSARPSSRSNRWLPARSRKSVPSGATGGRRGLEARVIALRHEKSQQPSECTNIAGRANVIASSVVTTSTSATPKSTIVTWPGGCCCLPTTIAPIDPYAIMRYSATTAKFHRDTLEFDECAGPSGN